MRILCVVGTRPNFVKMAAIFREMDNRKDYDPFLVHTGQHYDKDMSNVFFKELGLPEPNINLEIAGGSHVSQTALVMQRLEPIVKKMKPDVMIVVGDVNSSLAASITASQTNTPLAHVEAGLRSFDRTMPEEKNRVIIDHISDLLFVTEQSGINNLLSEGIPNDKIFFVGNVMVDTLLSNIEIAKQSNVVSRLNIRKGEFILTTLHRPANSDDKESLEGILDALCEISRDRKIVWPIHPRTKLRMKEFGLWKKIEDESEIIVTGPLGYLDFIEVMANAYAVLTDSGGIQEETTILGVPCVTMRNNTERPVTIDQGTNVLAGTECQNIVSA